MTNQSLFKPIIQTKTIDLQKPGLQLYVSWTSALQKLIFKLVVLLFVAIQIGCAQETNYITQKSEPNKPEIPEGINLLAECNWNFAADMIRGVNYIECDKDDLIQDFQDYMDYIYELSKAGENWREQRVLSVPNELKLTVHD